MSEDGAHSRHRRPHQHASMAAQQGRARSAGTKCSPCHATALARAAAGTELGTAPGTAAPSAGSDLPGAEQFLHPRQVGVNTTPLSQAAAAKPSGLWMASCRDYVLPFPCTLEGKSEKRLPDQQASPARCVQPSHPPRASRGRSEPTAAGSGNLVQNQAGDGCGGPRRTQLTVRGLHPGTSPTAQAVFCHKQHPRPDQASCWNRLTPDHVQHCACTVRELVSAQTGAAGERRYWGEAWHYKEQGTNEGKE